MFGLPQAGLCPCSKPIYAQEARKVATRPLLPRLPCLSKYLLPIYSLFAMMFLGRTASAASAFLLFWLAPVSGSVLSEPELNLTGLPASTPTSARPHLPSRTNHESRHTERRKLHSLPDCGLPSRGVVFHRANFARRISPFCAPGRTFLASGFQGLYLQTLSPKRTQSYENQQTQRTTNLETGRRRPCATSPPLRQGPRRLFSPSAPHPARRKAATSVLHSPLVTRGSPIRTARPRVGSPARLARRSAIGSTQQTRSRSRGAASRRGSRRSAPKSGPPRTRAAPCRQLRAGRLLRQQAPAPVHPYP